MISIDDYASSMFIFEELNPGWVTRCAAYIRHIFGQEIQGATVVDYAFGRGNWSLAFIEAGAETVIAIDASSSNVAKFSKYLTKNNVSGIKVVNANILIERVEAQADILWIYGILHHIDKPQLFLSELVKMWRPNGNGTGLLYSYNDNSLREVIVTLARRGLTYASYEEFRFDSFLFSHHARLRVRDDLSAPCVSWHSQENLRELLSTAGAFFNGSVVSFSEFENTGSDEFRPHHVLFGRQGAHKKAVTDSAMGIDESIILDLGGLVLSKASPSVSKQISVGITNTHFNALAYGGYIQALISDFLYFFYVFKVMKLSPINELMESVLELSDLSLRAIPERSVSNLLKPSLIASYLSHNTIRI